MDERKNKGAIIAWCKLGAACLLVVVIIIIGGLEANKEQRCSADAVGVLSEHSQLEYQYVGWYGGRLQTGYDNVINYKIDCAGAITELEFCYKGGHKPPDTIQVKYNPANPHEFYYDASEIPGAPMMNRSEGKWVYHKP